MAIKTVIVIVGPTAVGKTAAALATAQALHGEIISADSMQVYKGMDIGTAKPTPTEQALVRHHMIDTASPEQSFNVSDYVKQASAAVADCLARQVQPVVAGGTGLYVHALMDGFLFPDQSADPALRSRLMEEWQADPHILHSRLKAVDPATAGRLHPNDARRIIRALEVFERTGKSMSQLQRETAGKQARFSGIWIGLTRDRTELYQRIEQRVDAMFQQGLIEEVQGLLKTYPQQPTALQALGYKEVAWFLRGHITLEECVYLVKRDTRRFAKRQLSWFRRDQRLHWLNLTGMDDHEITARVVERSRKAAHEHGI